MQPAVSPTGTLTGLLFRILPIEQTIEMFHLSIQPDFLVKSKKAPSCSAVSFPAGLAKPAVAAAVLVQSEKGKNVCCEASYAVIVGGQPEISFFFNVSFVCVLQPGRSQDRCAACCPQSLQLAVRKHGGAGGRGGTKREAYESSIVSIWSHL